MSIYRGSENEESPRERRNGQHLCQLAYKYVSILEDDEVEASCSFWTTLKSKISLKIIIHLGCPSHCCMRSKGGIRFTPMVSDRSKERKKKTRLDKAQSGKCFAACYVVAADLDLGQMLTTSSGFFNF